MTALASVGLKALDSEPYAITIRLTRKLTALVLLRFKMYCYIIEDCI